MNKVKFILKNIHRIPEFLRRGISGSRYYKEDCFFNVYDKQFQTYLKEHNYQNQALPRESEYINKWSRLDSRVEPYSYRFFYHYMSEPLNIIPEAIGHLRIEEIINNQNHVEFYSDKNCYDLYLNDIRRPKTLLRRCGNNHILNSSYKKIADLETLNDICPLLGNACEAIMKPSIDSNSGIGVVKIVKNKANQWVKQNGEFLSISDLVDYKNFIIQECVKQSSYISQFCKTAINTFRICMYKSVVTGEWKITASVLRIGKDGCCVDNAHAGGVAAKIEPQDGTISKYLFDSHGNKYTSWNNLEFNLQEFKIPNWDEIKEFAFKVADKYVGFHLIALDICLDFNDKPVLIETNVKDFAFWLPMIFDFDVFDGEHDELINYCIKN